MKRPVVTAEPRTQEQQFFAAILWELSGIRELLVAMKTPPAPKEEPPAESPSEPVVASPKSAVASPEPKRQSKKQRKGSKPNDDPPPEHIHVGVTYDGDLQRRPITE